MKFVAKGILVWFCVGAILAGGTGSTAQDFTSPQVRRFPGNRSSRRIQPSGSGTTQGLQPMNNGQIVYDSNQNVYWLADANLAGNPKVRAGLGITGVNPNGSMDFGTAQKWVAALNAYNNGKGYLGHNNWQLPVAPLQDTTCADRGPQGASFGPLCTGSALGNLYYVGLNQAFPNSVAPDFAATVAPFDHMKLSYYWALQNNGGPGKGGGGGGQEMFAFSNGIRGGTTTKDSYYYVLPMVTGAIGTPPSCSAGSAVAPYTTGPAAHKAVYDCNTKYTWLADANLASSQNFGMNGNSTIAYRRRTITVPKINGGAMLFQTATQWIDAIKKSQYLGSSAWQMPASSQDFKTLVTDMNLASGDARLTSTSSFGPFQNLQPFFYWACQRDQSGSSQSPCIGYAPPGGSGSKPLQWSFNFDYGLQATSSLVQKYFVMVYYPAPTPPGKCGTPMQCCIKAGGNWNNGRCE